MIAFMIPFALMIVVIGGVTAATTDTLDLMARCVGLGFAAVAFATLILAWFRGLLGRGD